MFSGRELLLVFGRTEKDILATNIEPTDLVYPWTDYNNSHQIYMGGGGGGGGITEVVHDASLTGNGTLGNPLAVALVNWR